MTTANPATSTTLSADSGSNAPQTSPLFPAPRRNPRRRTGFGRRVIAAQALLLGIGGIFGATVVESVCATPAVAQTILDYKGLPTNPDGSVNKPAVQAMIAGGSTTLKSNGYGLQDTYAASSIVALPEVQTLTPDTKGFALQAYFGKMLGTGVNATSVVWEGLNPTGGNPGADSITMAFALFDDTANTLLDYQQFTYLPGTANLSLTTDFSSPITTALPGSPNAGTSYLTTVWGSIDPLRTSQYNCVILFEDPEGNNNALSSLYSPFVLERLQDRFIRTAAGNPITITDVPNGIDSVFKTFGQNGPTVTVVPEAGTMVLVAEAGFALGVALLGTKRARRGSQR